MTAATRVAMVRQAVQKKKGDILAIGKDIHAHPETGFKETRAVSRITALLTDLGFKVDVPYVRLPTAFRARVAGNGRGATTAVLAEYDALPGLGHGCGHNLITVTALAAAAGMAALRDRWPGRFEIIGTPAEEVLAGKDVMVRRGAFEHLDACFMTHPSVLSVQTTPTNAHVSLTARFHGRAAHAAASPQDGINALDAAILSFNNVHALRQHLREDARVHGIITNGGDALNVIPELAEIRLAVRSLDEDYLEELKQRVVTACRSAAKAVGARVTIRWDRDSFRSFLLNRPLDNLLSATYGDAGIRLQPGTGVECRASLDMANVSHVVPAAHPFFNIVPPGTDGVALHTREFLHLADTTAAYEEALKAGTGMALAAWELLANPDARTRMKQDFRGVSSSPKAS